MKFKKYILGSLSLIVVVSIFAFITFKENIVVDLYFTQLYLPIAFWVVAPMVLMFLLSLLHMFIHFIKFMFNEKNIKKDEAKLIKSVQRYILKEKHNSNFKNSILAHIEVLFNNSSMKIDDGFISEFEPFGEVIQKIERIKNKEYVDLRNYGLTEKNSWRQQNMRNKTFLDPKYALKVVKNTKKYTPQTRSSAISALIEANLLKEAKQYINSVNVDKNVAHKFFEAYSKNQEEELEEKEMREICKNYNFDRLDYIKLAKELKTNYKDISEYLQFFKNLALDIDEAFDGYICALIELEMTDKAIEVLSGVSYDKHKELNIYLQMKKANIKYPIEKFLNV